MKALLTVLATTCAFLMFGTAFVEAGDNITFLTALVLEIAFGIGLIVAANAVIKG